MKRTLVLLGVGLVLALGAGIAYAQATSSGSGWITQRGTFTVPVGQTVGDVLPLTGITLSGKCELYDYTPDAIIAWAVLEAATGKTMDAFTDTSSPGTVGGTSFTAYVDVAREGGEPAFGRVSNIIAVSNDAIATFAVGGKPDWASQTCTFMWQVVEAALAGSSPPGEPVPVSPGDVTGGPGA